MTDHTLAIRVASLYGPATLVALSWMLRPPPRSRAVGAFLATAWNLPALLLVNVLAMKVGWWTFAPSPASILGVPVDLLLGWVVLWGAVPALVLARSRIAVVVCVLAFADLLLMPLAAPVVQLGGSWLVGEIVALLVAAIPSQLLARWTAGDQRLEPRAAMLVVVFASLTMWVLPAVIFERVAGTWAPLLDNWRRFGGLHLQLVGLFALMGVSAVQEFAVRGRGTPLPFDPPRRLVTSGPYAYVANPMQLSLALALTAWGVILQSGWVTLAGPMALAYGLGLAAWDEHADLGARFGKPWRAYRRHVRDWIPRWHPYHTSIDDAASGALPAQLYVAAGCRRCSEVAHWFGARKLRGLEVVPAELHPARDLSRITYDPRDGSGDEEGVAAIARALEHINLGWAMLGSMLRLPVLAPLLQLLVDASGGEPRLVRRANAA